MDGIAAIAGRHGFSEEAGRAAAEALRRSGGAMAQFDHPELGGMGQWSRGGMLMIGDIFNDGLKARVRALLDDLAASGSDSAEPAQTDTTPRPISGAGENWWPADLGAPASSGAQNGMRYAVFPEAQRIAVERDGGVSVFDTGDRRITGVSQQQGGESALRFSGPDGTVDIEELPVVD